MALITGQISYYKLDDTVDSAGSFPLTNTGTVTFGSGLIGNAADYGATNTTKYLAIANAGGYTGTDYSFSIWVKLNTEISSGIYQLFNVVDQVTTFTRFSLGYVYNAGAPQISLDRVKLQVSDNFITYSSGFLGITNWYHIVVAYSSATGVVMYVNGVSRGTNAAVGNGNSGGGALTSFGIGIDNSVATPVQYSSALYDEVGTWNRQLTSSEVTQLYNAGAGLQYPYSAGASVNSGFFNFF